MTDFRVEREGLRWDFIIPTPRHSDGLGSSLEVPFARCLHKTLPSNYVVTLACSQLAFYGVGQDLVGTCLHELQLTTKGAGAS